jgi:hypothetical protein
LQIPGIIPFSPHHLQIIFKYFSIHFTLIHSKSLFLSTIIILNPINRNGEEREEKRRSRLAFQNLAVSWDAALVPGGGPGEEREMRGKKRGRAAKKSLENMRNEKR